MIVRFLLLPLYHLKILQDNWYYLGDYGSGLKTKFFTPANFTINQIDRTLKLMTVGILGLGLLVLDLSLSVIMFNLSSLATVVIGVLAVIGLYWVYLIVAVIVLKPVDYWLKNRIINRARRKIASLQNLKVVGVAGSYGKTTVKEFIAQSLKGQVKVVSTAENFNTEMGIANFILNDVSTDAEVLVLEMGEYQPGDIKKICSIAPPDIAVVTGINDAHLERMKSIQAIVATIFEVVLYSKDNAIIVLNGDDERVNDNYQKFLGQKEVVFYSSNDLGERPGMYYQNLNYHSGAPGMTFQVISNDHSHLINLRLIGNHLPLATTAGLAVAQLLGLNLNQSVQSIQSISQIPRRLEIHQTKYDSVIIDDAYNASPESVISGLKTMSDIYGHNFTAVLGDMRELGIKTVPAHQLVGHTVAEINPDQLITIGKKARIIAQTAIQNGFDQDRIQHYDTNLELLKNQPNVTDLGKVIYFKASLGMNFLELIDYYRLN